MKRSSPYHALLAVALVTASLAVFFNLYARRTYAVAVGYTLPRPQSVRLDAPPAESEDQAVHSVQFPLELNSASEEELRFIPQVGEVLSQRIVQYRELLGGYAGLEQLRDISGIGEQTYAAISAYLYIDQAAPEADGDRGKDLESEPTTDEEVAS